MTDYYRELSDFDDPALVDGWRHRLEQWLRFEIVRRGLQIEDEHSVVDLGCGTGRLLGYLGAHRGGNYLGVDRLQTSIKRAAESYGGDSFICTDLRDRCIDDAGPFDVAIAIGTLVDGHDTPSKRQRVSQLHQMMRRLDALGTAGWALVVLNQEMLEADPIRRLEPSLKGASRGEVKKLLDDLGIDAAVDSQALPSDLFVICRRQEHSRTILERLQGNEPHQRVLQRAANGPKYVDGADRAWFWLISGRLDKARQAITSLPDEHRRKTMLGERLRLMESG